MEPAWHVLNLLRAAVGEQKQEFGIGSYDTQGRPTEGDTGPQGAFLVAVKESASYILS